MLTLSAPQLETLWDGLLPVEGTSCRRICRWIDERLGDPELLRPIAELAAEGERRGRSAAARDRPTIAMKTWCS